MKKIVLSIICLIAAGSVSMAQSSSTATTAYSNGDNLFNAGIGFGSFFFGSGYSASLPINPSISYERGITDEISVGAQLSYASYKFNYDGFGANYSFKLNATYVGARGSYHLNEDFGIDPKFDLYAGGSLGYVVVSESDNAGNSGTLGSAFGYGVFAGGKYYFQPKLGVYAEVGYQSLSYLNIGVAFKL